MNIISIAVIAHLLSQQQLSLLMASFICLPFAAVQGDSGKRLDVKWMELKG